MLCALPTCNEIIPGDARSDALHCSKAHQNRHWNARRREGISLFVQGYDLGDRVMLAQGRALLRGNHDVPKVTVESLLDKITAANAA